MALQTSNKNELLRTATLLFQRVNTDETLEIRVLPDRDKHLPGYSGWYSTPEGFIEAAKEAASKYQRNIYTTINPSKHPPQRMDRVWEKGTLTVDADITRRLWIPLDIDPERIPAPAKGTKVNSTDAEKNAAKDVFKQVCDYLTGQGIDHVTADSGNGYHTLIPAEMPNDADSYKLVESFIGAIGKRFGTGQAKIDLVVKNSARILKVWGTLSRKGASTGDRPYRLSELLDVPEHLEVVTADKLRQAIPTEAPPQQAVAVISPPAIAATTVKAPAPVSATSKQGPWNKSNLQAYLDNTGWHGTQKTSVTAGFQVQWVGECILDPSHASKAVVGLNDSGWASYKCLDTHCIDALESQGIKGWQAFTAHYPDAKALLPVPAKKSHLSLSDIDMGRRFANQNRDEVRWLGLDGEWLEFTGKRWEQHSNTPFASRVQLTAKSLWRELAELKSTDPGKAAELEDDYKKAVNRYQNNSAVTGIPNCAKEFLDAKQDEFDTMDEWINVDNGTLNLKTGVLKTHAAADMLTQIAPVTFDPTAKCPLWLSFLNDITLNRPDLVACLQDIAGYSATTLTTGQVFFMLNGHGSNGKSTFLWVLDELLGDYAFSVTAALVLDRGDDMQKERLKADLPRKRLVYVGDLPENARLNESTIKMLTGSDKMSCRALYKGSTDFVPQFKLILNTNGMPDIAGQEHAIWRRVKRIPFDAKFDSDKGQVSEGLKYKLIEERSGILNWVLEGAKRVYSRLNQPGVKTIAYPPCVIEGTDEYRSTQDRIGTWMDDAVKTWNGDTTVWTSLDDLYRRYADDFEEGGMKPVGRNKFSLALRNEKHLRVERPEDHSGGMRVYGVTLR